MIHLQILLSVASDDNDPATLSSQISQEKRSANIYTLTQSLHIQSNLVYTKSLGPGKNFVSSEFRINRKCPKQKPTMFQKIYTYVKLQALNYVHCTMYIHTHIQNVCKS